MLFKGVLAIHKVRSVFVVWRKYQARVASMQTFFGYQTLYLPNLFSSKYLRVIDYMVKTLITIGYLMVYRPNTIWIQLPPTPLLYLLRVYKYLFRGTNVIADCHNSMLRPPWSKSPFAISLINSVSDLILVHNEEVYELASSMGLAEDKMQVLEDRPMVGGHSEVKNKSPLVVFPASFSVDEPISLVLEVARSLPEVSFVITGDYKRARSNFASHLPENVVLSGWLSTREYNRLLGQANLILGLTTFEGIQLSVASEAVGLGKAMVLSNTRILRELFPQGAIYVEPTYESLLNGIRKAMSIQPQLEEQVLKLRDIRIQRWNTQAMNVKKLIDEFEFRPKVTV
jgi:hypothetical protein